MFSETSRTRLLTCDETLQKLFKDVIHKRDCMIVCGFRNEEDQNKAFEDGFSRKRWPDGAHNRLPSMAVDVLPAPYEWDNIKAFKDFSEYVKERAAALRIGKIVRWGGDWENFRDYAHWEIVRPATPVPIKPVSTFDSIGLGGLGPICVGV